MLNKREKLKQYTTYDDKTYEKLLKVMRSMTAYSVDEPVRTKMKDVYYDDKKHILQSFNILLRKRITGRKALLSILRLHPDEQYYYMDKLRLNQRQTEIGAGDPLSKHFFFLNGALNSMFSTSLQFDPDKLFEQMRVTMEVEIEQEMRNILGFGGLKLNVCHRKLKINNLVTKRKNNIDTVTFKVTSPDETLPYFEDFMTGVRKHFKELFKNDDTEFELAYRLTKEPPSKEEIQKRLQEIEELKRKERSAQVKN